VRLGGKARLHPGGEGLGLVEAAADQSRRSDVKLAEVVYGVDIFRIELHGTFEGDSDLDCEPKSCKGAGMGRLESVCPAEPHLVITVGWSARHGEFTLMDGLVGQLLSIVDPAEKLVGLCIAGLRGEYLAKAGGRFIHTALLEKSVCLGCVGHKKANAEEEEKRKDQAHMSQRFRDEHV
jgi:hypothetical protein